VCSSSAKPLLVLILSLAATSTAVANHAPRAVTEGGGFEVYRSSVAPGEAYVAGDRPATLRFAFHSSGEPRRVNVRVIDANTGETYARWTQAKAVPGKLYKRSWNGSDLDGGSAPDGLYAFRISSPGRRDFPGGRFVLRGYKFPISGPHGTRGAIGEFGAERVDGRTHRGFDVTAPCGTDLEAVRGGEVERSGYDAELYGHFIEVDARSSRLDYFYAHMREPASAAAGDRVKTGEILGEVGLTGNASGTPCHLHVEIRASGRTVDPRPYLKRWDRYS
jgi:murein DD-endopeptidase MepM/ murein hydrolase activator NlpD